MSKQAKKILSLALALCLALTLLPTAAFAAGQVYRPQTGAELETLFSYANGGIPDGSTVYLEGKTYEVGRELGIRVNDLTIIGVPGTKIVLEDGTDVVMSTSESKNVTIRNLILGHDEHLTMFGGCSAGVLNVSTSSVVMENCELFGCGTIGCNVSGSTITMDHCTVRDCSSKAMNFSNSNADLKNCIFSGNGYIEKIRDDSAFSMWQQNFYSDKEIENYAVNFTNCTFTNNQNKAFYDISGEYAVTATNCTFTGNAWKDTSKDLAHASTQTVTVDGKPVEFQMYALKDQSGNDTNYIKLRDLAYTLNGTKAQFNVRWSGGIVLFPGVEYEANGSEMSTPFSGDRAYQGGPQTVSVNGRNVTLDAVILTDDAGNGYTYFKLRDLGEALGFTVDWSAEKGIFIETK